MSVLTFDEVKVLIENQLKGALPKWEKGWTGFASGVPMNPVSSHEFTGMNFILGWVLGERLGSHLWATQTQYFEEAKKIGFFSEVKKRGEKNNLLKRGEDGRAVASTTFVKPVFKKTELTKEQVDELRNAGKGGSVKEETFNGVTKHYLQLLIGFEEYQVYNINQVNPILKDMIEKKLGIGLNATKKNAGEFGKMVEALRIEVLTGRPSYSPTLDHIKMPPSEAFKDDQTYMGVLAHEVGHWTGAASRLNRNTLVNNTHFGSDLYSEEEAIAEWFSVLACSHFGLIKGGDDTVQSAAYIQGWTKKFENNPGLISDTFKAAEKAFRWFLKTAEVAMGSTVSTTSEAIAV